MTTRRCAHCGVVLPPLTPEREALAREELVENFGTMPVEDCGIVCDACYHQILAWMGHPAAAAQGDDR